MAATTTSCAHCGAAATTRCTGCIEGLDLQGNLSPTFYCDVECQKAAWPTHKIVCRHANYRKQLYRGAALVQEVFYTLRGFGFDYNPTEISNVNGKLRIRVNREKRPTKQGPLHAFADHLISDENDKKALLSWQASDIALAYMHELLQKVLKGIKSPANPPVEVGFPIEKSNEFISEVDGAGIADPTQYSHWGIRVDLKGAGDFIIDPAGAELSQYQAVVPATEYVQKYVGGGVIEQAFGSCRELWKLRRLYRNDTAFPSNYDYRLPRVYYRLAESVGRGLKGYEEKTSTVAAVLNLPKDKFEAEQVKILAIMDVGMMSITQVVLKSPFFLHDEGRKSESGKVVEDEFDLPPEVIAQLQESVRHLHN